MKNYVPPSGLRLLLIVVIALGICFRFVNLDHKVYWHDEVYTSLRVAGFTRQEIDNELFQNKLMAAPELQKFQQLKPGSTIADTVHSLAIEDPQHPPLYFLLARLWMQAFGSSVLASRALPALLSLLSLPLMYQLAMELFASRLLALVATALLAISPFDILFAQNAREYGLLTMTVIGSSWLLLRAIRCSTWPSWGLYTVSAAIGFYAHPLFGLTLAAQSAYVLLLSGFGTGKKQDRKPEGWEEEIGKPQAWKNETEPFSALSQLPASSLTTGPARLRVVASFVLAAIGALVLYIPWITVLLSNYQRAAETTDWTKTSVGLLYLVKLWILSFTALFIDLDFGFNNILTYLARLPIVLLIFAAVYFVCRRTPRTTWLLILTSILVPFLLLAIPDLLLGGKRSATTRYLIACYPAVQLAIAYLLGVGLARGKPVWRWLLALLLTGSVVSCSASGLADAWWSSDLSYANPEVARLVNAQAAKTSPIMVSDMGDDYTNTGDLISLSYLLKDNVRLFLVSKPSNLTALTNEANVFVFRPSKSLGEAIAKTGRQSEEISIPGRLWHLKQ